MKKILNSFFFNIAENTLKSTKPITRNFENILEYILYILGKKFKNFEKNLKTILYVHSRSAVQLLKNNKILQCKTPLMTLWQLAVIHFK